MTFILCISAHLWLIKLKFDMPLEYALGRFVFEFYKNQMSDVKNLLDLDEKSSLHRKVKGYIHGGVSVL